MRKIANLVMVLCFAMAIIASSHIAFASDCLPTNTMVSAAPASTSGADKTVDPALTASGPCAPSAQHGLMAASHCGLCSIALPMAVSAPGRLVQTPLDNAPFHDLAAGQTIKPALTPPRVIA
jgi:hypothetical protein